MKLCVPNMLYNHQEESSKMTAQVLEEKIETLNNRMRVLILQNARETSGYDKVFLHEMRRLADQILNLQNELEIKVNHRYNNFNRRLTAIT